MTRNLFVLTVLTITIPAAAGDPPITALALSPDAQHVVAGSVAGLRLLDAETLAVTRSLPTELEQVYALQFSPDGEYLAAAGGVPGETGEIELYGWPETERIGRWDPAVDVLYALDWSPDGKSLVAVGFDETAWLISLPEQTLSQWHPGHSRPITAVCLLPNPDANRRDLHAVTAGVDQSLRVYNFSTETSLRALHNHTAPIQALAAQSSVDSPLPVLASIGADRTVRFWQPTIGRMMRFVRLTSVPLCLAWTSDGSRLCVGCADGQLRVIDPRTAEILSELSVSSTRLLSIVVHPDDEAVFVGTDDGDVLQVDVSAD